MNYDLTKTASLSRWWDVLWIAVLVAFVWFLTSRLPRGEW
jgi:hypothetical protein